MKYIIDIPEQIAEAAEEYWEKSTGMTLEPYTEPDRKTIEDEVWETIRKIFTDGTLSGDEGTDPVPFYDCFGEYYFHEVLRKMSYQEAKTKYEEWKNRNICVGDEVIYNSRTKAIVLIPETKENYGTILTDEFATIVVSHDDLKKTGRYFDDIAELLKKMKEKSE